MMICRDTHPRRSVKWYYYLDVEVAVPRTIMAGIWHDAPVAAIQDSIRQRKTMCYLVVPSATDSQDRPICQRPMGLRRNKSNESLPN